MLSCQVAGANLTNADLSNAALGEEPFPADLAWAIMNYADLSDAYFHKANLYGADLKGADLSGAYMKGANLTYAQLSGATLKGTEIGEGTTLIGANLAEHRFEDDHFASADLSEVAGLKQEHLKDTVGDRNTRLPDGLKPPESWGEPLEEQYADIRKEHSMAMPSSAETRYSGLPKRMP
jgi:hypothetical protein